MFKRGFAKPFYIKGHRIHHNTLYVIVPMLYGIFLAWFFLGYVQLIWNSFWDKLAITFVLVAVTLTVDFIGDKYWPKIRMDVILHHEWVYAILPVLCFHLHSQRHHLADFIPNSSRIYPSAYCESKFLRVLTF